MGVGFEEISIFLKERAYGQVGILGHAAVVAFAAAAFTGEHGAGGGIIAWQGANMPVVEE